MKSEQKTTKVPLLLLIISIMGDDWHEMADDKKTDIEHEIERAFQIKSLETDSELVSDDLGITRERAKELSTYAKEVFMSSDHTNVSQMLEKLSEPCRTKEELALSAFGYGFNLCANRNPLAMAIGAMASVFRTEDEDGDDDDYDDDDDDDDEMQRMLSE